METYKDAQELIQKLFASRNKIFLIAAGCSKCAGLPLMDELTSRIVNECEDDKVKLSPKTKEILKAVTVEINGNSSEGESLETDDDLVSADDLVSDASIDNDDGFDSDASASTSETSNALKANIENYLSQIMDYMAIAVRRHKDSRQVAIGDNKRVNCTYEELQHAINEIKQMIVDLIEVSRKSNNKHREFVREIHREQRPGRVQNFASTYYVVMNYDTLLEDALGLESVSCLDGMSGGATGWWNPLSFNERNHQAIVLKLHGSIDWYGDKASTAIRRLPHHLRNEFNNDRVIIAPADTKYAESQSEPFATLMSKFDELLKPNSILPKDKVMFIIGYGFGDKHVNIRLENALRQNKNLTLVVFIQKLPKEGSINDWLKDETTRERLIICSKKHFISNGEKYKLSKESDWWKFEKFVKLIGESK